MKQKNTYFLSGTPTKSVSHAKARIKNYLKDHARYNDLVLVKVVSYTNKPYRGQYIVSFDFVVKDRERKKK